MHALRQKSELIVPDRNLVFILGCPRSGTTWLQLLLSQHPHVASAQETHLFSGYIGPMYRRWEAQTDNWRAGRDVGLPSVMEDAGFIEAIRGFSDSILDRVWGEPQADRIYVEKTPQNYKETALLQRLYPEARYLHMVRDPRAVSASLLAASRGWGRHWAPSVEADAARMWSEAVRAGILLEETNPRCLRVRYESLEADGPETLSGLLDWLGLPRSEGDAESAVERCSIDRLKKAAGRPGDLAMETAAEVHDPESPGSDRPASPWDLPNEPDGFFRSGGSEGWREELSPSQVATIEYVARQEIEALEYGFARYAGGGPPARLRLRNGLKRLRKAAAGGARFVSSRF
jgi:hypothetical protein